VRIGRFEALTHLLFIDDLILFFFWQKREGRCLKKILQLYNTTTCMEINENKSTIYIVGFKGIHDLGIGVCFPFQHLEMLKGVKYSGFTLKPNCYGNADWYWLLSKIEKCISFWCNRWLSRGGRLVLINLVLEAILVYYHTLAHIPKWILEKIRKFCFNFLWQGSNDYQVNNLVKWQKMEAPKSLGGWGIKNINLFGRALEAK
jgi:hypothetical protein